MIFLHFQSCIEGSKQNQLLVIQTLITFGRLILILGKFYLKAGNVSLLSLISAIHNLIINI
jgi:hypothetical protein